MLWIKDGGQAEIHTAEPLVPEPSASEVELVIHKLKSHKSPSIDQILAEILLYYINYSCLTRSLALVYFYCH